MHINIVCLFENVQLQNEFITYELCITYLLFLAAKKKGICLPFFTVSFRTFALIIIVFKRLQNVH